MDDLILIRPTNEYASQIAEYRQEFLDCGDSMDGCGILRKIKNPKEYISLCNKIEKSENNSFGLVAATQLILIRKNDNKLIGMLDIRHYLNDYLEKFGGNIGYSIRPSERRKGYAKRMLGMALPICKELGLTKLLLTCNENNIISEKTILANGGVYESMIFAPNNTEAIKRFWITL